jgi:hypothetical protein
MPASTARVSAIAPSASERANRSSISRVTARPKPNVTRPPRDDQNSVPQGSRRRGMRGASTGTGSAEASGSGVTSTVARLPRPCGRTGGLIRRLDHHMRVVEPEGHRPSLIAHAR